jgi:glycosyltransferase involved in cell wall biosynthesis
MHKTPMYPFNRPAVLPMTRSHTAIPSRADRRRIAIMFSMFGPYHVARLNAAAVHHDVIGIEVSATSDTYAWDKFLGTDIFQRVTLFTNTSTSRKSYREISAKVCALLSSYQPDVVVVPGWASSWACSMLGWSTDNGVPAIVMSDSQAIDFDRVWWREWIKHRVVRTYSAAIVGGKRHVHYLEQLGMPGDRVTTGYDVVDNEHFATGAARAREWAEQLRRDLRLPKTFFLASARFVEKKNLPLLVEAFARYRAKVGSAAWSLVILGDGELRPALERDIRERALSFAVLLPGFKQYDALPNYYGLASAFVHVSTSEQWGLVVNEAAASGLPVIVSERCGCAPELVESGVNGFVVDPYDVESVAGAMYCVASPECDRAAMGMRSREIARRWGPETFAESLRDAVDMALTRPRPPCRDLDRMIIELLARTCGSEC